MNSLRNLVCRRDELIMNEISMMKNIDVKAIKEAAMKLNYRDWKACRNAVNDSFESSGRADEFVDAYVGKIKELIQLCSHFNKRQWFAVSSAIDAQFIGVIDKARIDISNDSWFKFCIRAGL